MSFHPITNTKTVKQLIEVVILNRNAVQMNALLMNETAIEVFNRNRITFEYMIAVCGSVEFLQNCINYEGERSLILLRTAFLKTVCDCRNDTRILDVLASNFDFCHRDCIDAVSNVLKTALESGNFDMALRLQKEPFCMGFGGMSAHEILSIVSMKTENDCATIEFCKEFRLFKRMENVMEAFRWALVRRNRDFIKTLIDACGIKERDILPHLLPSDLYWIGLIIEPNLVSKDESQTLATTKAEEKARSAAAQFAASKKKTKKGPDCYESTRKPRNGKKAQMMIPKGPTATVIYDLDISVAERDAKCGKRRDW